MSLTKKRESFCQEYTVDKNGAQAAERAGYAKASARITASQLLTNPNVIKRIDELLALLAQATQVNAESVINGIKDTIERCVNMDKPDNASVLRGYELLGRHLKLFTDKVEVRSSDYSNMSSEEVDRELAAARQENDNIKAEVH